MKIIPGVSGKCLHAPRVTGIVKLMDNLNQAAPSAQPQPEKVKMSEPTFHSSFLVKHFMPVVILIIITLILGSIALVVSVKMNGQKQATLTPTPTGKPIITP